MSLRRILPALGLGLVASALVAACLPWSIEAPGAARFVSGALQRSWGVALSARGPTEVVLLPLPRIVFRDIRLNEGDAAGPVLASGGHLSLQLGPAALLLGRVEVDSLTLEGAEVLLPQDAGDTRWSGATERLTHSIAGEDGERPRRIILARCSVTGLDPRDGTLRTAHDVDLTVSWPTWSESLALTGGFRWSDGSARITLAGLRPYTLFSGGESPFSVAATWPTGSLNAEGRGSVRDGLRASGTGSLQTRSLHRTLALTGGGLALSPFVEDFSVEGSFEAGSGQVQFPNVTVRSDGNSLEGAGSATFGSRRTAVQATLAAENLNLSPLLAGILRLTGFDHADDAAARARSLDLRPFTGGDLDLRISAGNARIGPVQLTDLASSVLVRDGGIEASLGRASLRGGIVKGRVSFAADDGDAALTRVKAQGSFDRLDLGDLLDDLGQSRWMLGATRGSLALEAAGHDVGALTRSVSGRVALESEDGALSGLDLADVIHRGGTMAPGALARRNGRTPFEHAAVTLLFADGVGEIVEGRLASRTLGASLNGRIALADRRFQALAEIQPRTNASADGAPPAATQFEIAGPWDAVSVRASADPQAGGVDARRRALPDLVRRPGADLPLGIRAYAPANASAGP
ncbi:AsmA family protein [Methylorubrum rhodesianum]|jgi:AsmA protein|uniref:AsmA family protein n=1 Tax=Methylorubrum rhodesianum TaxID=29427 RepID=A0ABU9ZFA7_9HYPH|nr:MULTISPECIES: AsmA family protein [Methylorubrum]MBB5761014.1 AsmA protein [Methylorubrum rhodesianum]MBI1687834.1 AsmA family protein [Methylorubrum sp. DB1722]MBK3404654.1 AsmA family protein [Methylorubrum rhodesianum]MBY0140629.1 AsmA family protein [Methylorubrum populi]